MSLQPNLECVLNKVNNFINIDAHRQYYTDNFNHLTNTVFKNLRQNEVFAYMFNGFQLEGSYGDNVKVSLPNEFDLVFHITFPEKSLINVIEDTTIPGNVILDFTKVLKKIANEKQHEKNLKHLKQCLDENNFLKVEKFQLFIQSWFVNVLSLMENKLTFEDETFSLRYKRQGPAHTISVYSESLDLKYSVDFVPGILLSDKQSIIPNLKGQWKAIPKPSQTDRHKSTSFRASYYQQEKEIIDDKHQLKNVYRMLKKFRDNKTNMSKLKSYFIKTLFLHKAKGENPDYWKKTMTEITIDMFIDLEKSLVEEKLPFFWNQKLNLYENYSPRLMREVLSCVERSRETLQKAAIQLTMPLQSRVYRIFLNTSERCSLESQITKHNLINKADEQILSLSPKFGVLKEAEETKVYNNEAAIPNKSSCVLC